MKKIPSNNSLFSISNMSSSKIYMTAFVNKINDEFLEDSPYSIVNFVKDNLSPSTSYDKLYELHHSSNQISYHDIPVANDIPIYFFSIFIFIFYYFIQYKEFNIISNNQQELVNKHQNDTNIINCVLLALFIIFSRNIENAI